MIDSRAKVCAVPFWRGRCRCCCRAVVGVTDCMLTFFIDCRLCADAVCLLCFEWRIDIVIKHFICLVIHIFCLCSCRLESILLSSAILCFFHHVCRYYFTCCDVPPCYSGKLETQHQSTKLCTFSLRVLVSLLAVWYLGGHHCVSCLARRQGHRPEVDRGRGAADLREGRPLCGGR